MEKRSGSYRPKHAVVAGRMRGGFVPVKAAEMLAAWRLYANNEVELRDLRLWLASIELRAEARFRRGRLCRVGTGVRLRKVAGDRRSAGAVHARLSVVSAHVESEAVDVQAEYFRNLRRRVPVPRRLARHLASEGTCSTIAAAIGHLLRCMYWRGESCVSGGTAKASAMAAELGVSVRSIRRGRKALRDEGWLESVAVAQHVLNRHGAVVRVRCGHRRSARLSPPRPDSGSCLSPPKNKHQLRCLLETRTNASSPRSVAAERDRLSDRGFGERLFRKLACSGHIAASESARLAVLSCAQYAARVATRNPMGLFWHLIQGGHWDRPALRDEDAARRSPPIRTAGALDPVGAVIRSSGVLPRADATLPSAHCTTKLSRGRWQRAGCCS